MYKYIVLLVISCWLLMSPLKYEDIKATMCLTSTPLEYQGVRAAVYWWDQYLKISPLSEEEFREVYGFLRIKNIPEVKQTFLAKLNTNLTRMFSDMRCGLRGRYEIILSADYNPEGLLDEFFDESDLETEYEEKNHKRALDYPWKFSMRILGNKASIRANHEWKDINIKKDSKFENKEKSTVMGTLSDACLDDAISSLTEGKIEEAVLLSSISKELRD
jgi:hypothetical protein